jgi:hypothetical protein
VGRGRERERETKKRKKQARRPPEIKIEITSAVWRQDCGDVTAKSHVKTDTAGEGHVSMNEAGRFGLMDAGNCGFMPRH